MITAPDFAMAWPPDGQDAFWSTAHRFAQGHPTARPQEAGNRQAAADAFRQWLDSMHGLGWASLCASRERGGQGQPVSTLCRVLEAVSAVDASAAAAVYASAAAHLALNLSAISAERQSILRDLSVDWLAWPAFHDVDEQLWPAVDAQGYLRGQTDLLLNGAHANWAVVPAQAREGLGIALVDLRHPAVIRGAAQHGLGLAACGINDVEFGGVPCELVSLQGREVFEALSDRLAPAVMALQCGVSRASLSLAMTHAAQRVQGGGPLLGWGEVRRVLSLMQERLHVMQALLATSLGRALPAGGLQARHGALHVGDLACLLTSDGMQIFGGMGYMNTQAQAVRLCDARQIKGLLGGVARRRQALLRVPTSPSQP